MADPRNNSIPYVVTGETIPAAASVSTFAPALGQRDGTIGLCGMRTIWSVLMTNRKAAGLSDIPMAMDFIASMWFHNPPNPDGAPSSSIYSLTVLPRAGFSLIKTFGALPQSLWPNGLRIPTSAQYSQALGYKGVQSYQMPFYAVDSPNRIAAVKEVIARGFAVACSTGVQTFPYNGGGYMAMPAPGTSEAYSHVFTALSYDDAARSGAGEVSGVTNGIGLWSMEYATFNRYCNGHAFLAFEPLPVVAPTPEEPIVVDPVPEEGVNTEVRDDLIAAATALSEGAATVEERDEIISLANSLVLQAVPPVVENPNLALGRPVTATSTFAGRSPLSVTDGDRKAFNYVNAGLGGMWKAASLPSPTNLQGVTIDFGAVVSVGKVICYGAQASPPTTPSYLYPVEPTDIQTSDLANDSFYAEGWNGTAWVALGAKVTGNTLVKKSISFTPVSVSKVRVLCSRGDARPNSVSTNHEVRWSEVEVYAS